MIIPSERVDEWLTESAAPMQQPTLWLDFAPVFQEEPAREEPEQMQMSFFD